MEALDEHISCLSQGKAITHVDNIRREPGFEQPHKFVVHNFYSSTICNYCLKPIRGINAGQWYLVIGVFMKLDDQDGE